MEEVLFIR